MDPKREIEMAELKEDIREEKLRLRRYEEANKWDMAMKVQEGLNIMLRRLEEKEKQGESQPKSLLPCMAK